jgi:hypothetical protein
MQKNLSDKVVALMQRHQFTLKDIQEILIIVAAWVGDMSTDLSDEEFEELIEKLLEDIEQSAREYRPDAVELINE